MITIRQIKLANPADNPEQMLELTIGKYQDGDEHDGFSCTLVTWKGDKAGKDKLLSGPGVNLEEAEAAFVEFIAAKMAEGYEETFEEEQDTTDDGESLANFVASGDLVRDMRERIRIVSQSGDKEKLNRLIWRIGDMVLAHPEVSGLGDDLIRLVNSGDDVLDYCVAWSLGRMHNPAGYGVLELLHKSSESLMVKRMALEAMLAIADERQLDQLIGKTAKKLPEAVVKQIKQEAGSADDLDSQIDSLISTQGVGASELFNNFYILSLGYPRLRQLLLDAITKIPVSANFYKALRLLLKTAEFRLDAEMYGLALYRIETTPSPYGRNAWDFEYIRLPGTFEYVQFEQEIEKNDCRIAYSSKSRDYLRRRAVRFLKRLARLDGKRYVEFAVSSLLPFTDADGNQLRFSRVKDWRPNDEGEWQQVVVASKKYGEFSGYPVFNQVLHAHSSRFRLAPSRRAWIDYDNDFVPPQPDPEEELEKPDLENENFSGNLAVVKRLEDRPELWDQHPEALLRLLLESRCGLVHRFAARALFDNREFLRTLTHEQLECMLSSDYEITAALALETVRERFSDALDENLVSMLLHSGYEQARAFGLESLDSNPHARIDAETLYPVLINPWADVREWGRKRLGETGISVEDSTRLMNSLFEFILSLQEENEQSIGVVKDISEVLTKIFVERLQTVEMKTVDRMLHHPLAVVQAVAGEVLIHHSISAEFLPAKVYYALIESRAPNVRDVGLRMFQQLPKPVLISQAEMLVAFCLSEHDTIRDTVKPVIGPLVDETPELGDKLVLLFVQQLLKANLPAPTRTAILQIVRQDLGRHVYSLDKETVWQLLESPHRPVQLFGSHLLGKRLPSSWSVRHWARLASHNLYEVRRWAWKAFEENVEEVKVNAGDAVRMLESGWQETRQFAMRYFLNYFTDRDWTPEMLISICDSQRAEIQKFGCELVLDYFQEGQGVEYLMKLSQHPALRVNEFVVNFLARYAAGQPERIQVLVPYFRSVLAMVSRGRKLKNIILDFIQQQSMETREIAEVLVPVLNEFSASCVARDRDRVMEILTGVKLAWPDISTPLQLVLKNESEHRRENMHGV